MSKGATEHTRPHTRPQTSDLLLFSPWQDIELWHLLIWNLTSDSWERKTLSFKCVVKGWSSFMDTNHQLFPGPTHTLKQALFFWHVIVFRSRSYIFVWIYSFVSYIWEDKLSSHQIIGTFFSILTISNFPYGRAKRRQSSFTHFQQLFSANRLNPHEVFRPGGWETPLHWLMNFYSKKAF